MTFGDARYAKDNVTRAIEWAVETWAGDGSTTGIFNTASFQTALEKCARAPVDSLQAGYILAQCPEIAKVGEAHWRLKDKLEQACDEAVER